MKKISVLVLASIAATNPLAAPSQAQTTAARGTALETAKNRAFIAGAFAKWAAGGRTFFDDVLAPDVVWTIKGTSPVAGAYRGRKEFIDRAVTPFAARLAAPIKPTVTNIWAEGDQVVVQWDGATTTKDGNPYANSYVWIFRMANGRASEVTAYLDLVAYDTVLSRPPK
ncbi:nuclear transport factor 2 family protein [Massilia sp. CMS3.1]|uniref:nuclear transport factor 2 family protein n=1 Tax=Massilia sp. CMS3.1 TaxID=3373083 RepID=UPI003EE6C80D